MASRYVVAAGGAWSSTATWSATSGGAGGASVPTAVDDVHLDANSGPLTLDTNGAGFLSFDCTGYTGSLTHNATVKMNGGSNLAASGLILKLVTTMTYTLVSTSTSEWTFNASTTGVTGTVTCASKTVGNMTFGNNPLSSHQLVDGYAQGASAATNHPNGTLDTNGQPCSWGAYSSAVTNVRTLTLGASTITQTGNSRWDVNTTNYTFNAGTSTVQISGNSSTSLQVNSGLTFYTLVMNTPNTSAILSAGSTVGSATLTCTNLTISQQSASKTQVLTIQPNVVVTGTLTIQGTASTTRPIVSSSIVGTAVSITANGTVALSDADLMDIAASGSAGTWTGTRLGDAQGNSGITFDASRTLYAVGTGGTKNWDSTAVWSLSSGGASGQYQPLPQDDVIVDANSIPTSQITGNGVLRLCRNLDMSAWTGVAGIFTSSASIYGNIALGPLTATSGTSPFTLAGRGAQTLRSNGAAWSTGPAIAAPGGGYTLQDDLSLLSGGVYRNLQLNAGTFNSNSFGINAAALTSNSSVTRAWNLGSSRVELWGTGGGNPFSFAGGGTVTYSFASATFNLHGSGSGVVQIAFFDGTTVGAVNVLNPGSGVVQITGSFTASALSISPGRAVTVTVGKTITIADPTGWKVLGQNWNAAGFQYVTPSGGNTITTPDAAPVKITGDITVEGRVFPINGWAAAGNYDIATKWGGAGTQSYAFLVASGICQFYWSTTGSDGPNAAASVNLSTLNLPSAPVWLRASFQANNGSAGKTATFWYSMDGVAWTQIGSAVTSATAITIFNSTAAVEIGSQQNGAANPISGQVYRVRIYNSALGSGSGTPVFDADFGTKTWGANSFIESSANAATVSITGTGMQAGDGRIQWNSTTNGTAWNVSVASGKVASDYVTLQDSHAAGGATFYAGSHSTLVSNDTGWTAADPPAPPSLRAGAFDPSLNPTAWF